MSLTHDQVVQLLQPINPRRVLKDGKNHSHVSQQDVTAHLIRVFGFGNFDTEILTLEPVYETPHASNRDSAKTVYDVCYRVTMRLTIKDQDGNRIASYEDGSTGVAQNQPSLADAHDLAMKSAISVAKKRCAINLGDQFGLSLYNKGQMTGLVMGTMVGLSSSSQDKTEDIQQGVEQQVSLGADETSGYDEAVSTPEQEQALAGSLGAKASA